MWSKSGTILEGAHRFASREEELRSDPSAFGELIAHGARLFRHAAGEESQQDSAQAIVRHVIQQSWSPVTLAIQHELVNEKRALEDTDAGIVLCAELREAIRNQAETFRADMEHLLKTGDEEHAAEITAERDRIREESKKTQEQTQAMAVSIEALRQQESTLYAERLGRAEQELRDELIRQKTELTSMRRQLVDQKRRQDAEYALQQEQRKECNMLDWARMGPEHHQHAQQLAQPNQSKTQKELLELETLLKQREEAFALDVQRHHAARAKKMEFLQAVASAVATGAMGGVAGALCVIQ